jgi:RNA polymerase sigma-70 factor (ECF subfamily)
MTAGTRNRKKLISVDNQAEVTDAGRAIAEARGNAQPFVQLYRAHYDAVFRYCAHRLFDRQAAEDATSEVFLKVVQNLGRFKGEQRRFRSWLYRVASNVAKDHLRRAARRRRLHESASRRAGTGDVDCPPGAEASAEKLALLKTAVLSLKPRYQTIITLRFFENLKLTEIAEVLDSSPGTVRSQLARALSRLRARLRALGICSRAGEWKNG